MKKSTIFILVILVALLGTLLILATSNIGTDTSIAPAAMATSIVTEGKCFTPPVDPCGSDDLKGTLSLLLERAKERILSK